MSYVYLKSEPQLWTVGFYTPGGDFASESDHASREEAAERVRWLNGANETIYPKSTVTEWVQSPPVNRSLRYRVNVSTSVKGVKTWDCTTDGENYTMEEILAKSDALVKALEDRYSPKPEQKEETSELQKG